ncbi:MAG: von Willebrand factor type A domain-containing protein [Actinomycetota bacterium]|nr:von Willebrand factor type A domain-containing protein [Actinomycetota bacterium]
MALVGGACSGGEEQAGPTTSATVDGATGDRDTTTTTRPGIDPERYVLDYEEGADEDSGAMAPSLAAPADLSAGVDEGGGAEPRDLVPEPPIITPPTTEPGVLDDNTFEGSEPAPFIDTAADPRSTFGLDVDTGSWNVGQTLLSEGYRPEPDSVRVEEYVNAQDYDYPEVTDGDLAVHVDHGPAPFAPDGTQLVRVGVSSRQVDAAARPDANLTFVVDTSGSMDIRERLGLVRASLAVLARDLRPTDSVGVVIYGSEAGVLLEPTPVGEGATELLAAIDELVPGGSTNMEAGLRTGYRLARDAYVEGEVNTVVLASDGVANVGDTGPGSLAEMIREEGRDGVNLVTVGFGMGNYNDELMEQLADRGDGFYAYVDTFAEAERLFSTELTSTLVVVASDAKIQVAWDPEVVSGYRLLGYENRAVADDAFRDDTVDAGEVGAGHTVTALYEVRPADATVVATPDEGGAGVVAGTVALRYESTASGEVVETSTPIALGGAPRDGFGLAGATAAYAEVLRDHPVVAERGVTLEAVAALVDELVAAGEPGAEVLAETVDRALRATPPVAPVED